MKIRTAVILWFCITATLAIISACAHEAERTDIAGRGVKVERLFEHEGVVVYRFTDGSRYHYYVVPRSGTFAQSFSEWSESCGRNCTHTVLDEIPTVARR